MHAKNHNVPKIANALLADEVVLIEQSSSEDSLRYFCHLIPSLKPAVFQALISKDARITDMLYLKREIKVFVVQHSHRFLATLSIENNRFMLALDGDNEVNDIELEKVSLHT